MRGKFLRVDHAPCPGQNVSGTNADERSVYGSYPNIVVVVCYIYICSSDAHFLQLPGIWWWVLVAFVLCSTVLYCISFLRR